MFLLVKIVMNNISVALTRELDLLSPFTINSCVHNVFFIPDLIVILAVLVVCS